MRRVKVMYCQIFVSPGIGAVLQTTFLRKVFMIEDLPVLGYPIKPTETCFRFEWSIANGRNSAIRDPLPKEFVSDA